MQNTSSDVSRSCKNHTCSEEDCVNRGLANLDNNDQPITECMNHTKLRTKREGAGAGKMRAPGDNIRQYVRCPNHTNGYIMFLQYLNLPILEMGKKRNYRGRPNN